MLDDAQAYLWRTNYTNGGLVVAGYNCDSQTSLRGLHG